MVSKRTTGERVRTLRLQKGWSQSDLARETGWTQARISQIEASENLRTATARKLASVLKCHPGWLLTGP